MTAVRKLAAVLILLFATNAWAYRGRPVSDMSFDGRVLASYEAIASDGTDFLVLTSIGPTREQHAFVQKVVNGRPVGPQRQVGPGRAAGLVWTGSNYLAAWEGLQGVFIAPVSRDGSPLSTPTTTPTAPVARGLNGFLATNQSSALVFGYIAGGALTAQPIDHAGRETGPPITHATPQAWESRVASAAAADGFAMVFSGSTGTWLMLFRADGSAITSSAILLDGPGTNATTGYESSRAVLATDGTDTLIVFGAGVLGGDAELKSVVVAANGKIKSKRVLQTISVGDRTAFLPTGLVWDGSQYVAAVNVKKDQYGNDIDAALVRIARDGDRAGELTWLAERHGFQSIGHLGWNGRELALTMQDIPSAPNAELQYLTLNPSTLLPEMRSVLGRTLPAQDHVTIAAGHDGFLAAWFEHAGGLSTLRASRIDAAGNYLDGEGIVLDTLTGDTEDMIAIDGNGPRWLVVWSNENEVRARFVSRGGVAGIGPIAIGPGPTAAVRWDGSQYVVLRSDNSLHSSSVLLDGSVRDAKTLAAFERIDEPAGWRWIFYLEPALVRLAGHTIAVYRKEEQFCDGTSFPCPSERTILGLRLDAIDAAPFVIANDVWATVTATESPAGALLTWRGKGTFLPAESPENSAEPFPIQTDGNAASFAFDGSDFIAAWDRWSYPHNTIVSARIGTDGTMTRNLVLSVNPDEHASAPVIAASATLPPIIGFVQRHAGSDGVARAALLLVSDIEDAMAAPVPAPSIVSAAKNIDGTITVHWQAMQNVFGVSIELELSDGTFRPIGVASSRATTARVSTGGLEGDGVRVRAWNASGLSEPSSTATIVSGRRRSARQ